MEKGIEGGWQMKPATFETIKPPVEKDGQVVEVDAVKNEAQMSATKESSIVEGGRHLSTYERHKNALRQILKNQAGDHTPELLGILDQAFEAARAGKGDVEAFVQQAETAAGTDRFSATRVGLVRRAFNLGSAERADPEHGKIVVEDKPTEEPEANVAEQAVNIDPEVPPVVENESPTPSEMPRVESNAGISSLRDRQEEALEDSVPPQADAAIEVEVGHGPVLEVPPVSENEPATILSGESATIHVGETKQETPEVAAEDGQRSGFNTRMAGFGNRERNISIAEQLANRANVHVAGFARPLEASAAPGGESSILQKVAEAYPNRTLTKEEIEAARESAEEALKSMSTKERKKIGVGFHNWGLYVKSWSAEQLETAIRKAGGTGEWADAWAHTYHKQYLEAEKDIALAQEARQNGGSGFGMRRSLGSAGFVASMATKAARLGLSSFGVIPFRGLMALSMATAKGSEVIREVNERRVANTTRIEDADKAQEEAMALYEQAQKRVADGEVTKKTLDQVYSESLPAELKERLDKLKPEDRNAYLERKIQGFVVNRVADFNTKLEASGTEEERRELTRKYSRMLNKYSRLIEETGTVHTFAWGAEKAEMVSKLGIAALSAETWLRGIKATGVFRALGSFMSRAKQIEMPTMAGVYAVAGKTWDQLQQIPERVEDGAKSIKAGLNEFIEQTTPSREASEIPRGRIDHLGVRGAVLNVLRNEQTARAFGWTGEGKPDLNWRNEKTLELWEAYEKQALKDPAFRARMTKLGYSEDRLGLQAMMKRMEKGEVRLNPKTNSLEIVADYERPGSQRAEIGRAGAAANPVAARPAQTPGRFGARAAEAATVFAEQGPTSGGQMIEMRLQALDGRMRELLSKNNNNPLSEPVRMERQFVFRELEEIIKGAKTDAERKKIINSIIAWRNSREPDPMYAAMNDVLARHGEATGAASTPHEAEQAVAAMRAKEMIGTGMGREAIEVSNKRIEETIFKASGGSMDQYGRNKASNALLKEITSGKLTLNEWLAYYVTKGRLDQVSADLRKNYEEIFNDILNGSSAQRHKAETSFFYRFSALIRPEYR
jgi:hypothetical protein